MVKKPRDGWKRVVGLDPGSANFGISLVDMEVSTGAIRPVRTSLLKSPVRSLARGLPAQVAEFVKEMDGWLLESGAHGWVAERFQSRGLMGATVELVTFMCGVMAAHYRLPYKLVTAATWKNQVNRKIAGGWSSFDGLDTAYKWAKIQPHQLDSALIAVYGLEQGTDVAPRYGLRRFIKRLENRTEVPLINRVARR